MNKEEDNRGMSTRQSVSELIFQQCKTKVHLDHSFYYIEQDIQLRQNRGYYEYSIKRTSRENKS